MRLDDLRSRHRQIALERGVNPRDVDLLLADLLGKPVAWIIAHEDAEVDAGRFEALAQRRYAGEPLQYIRGRTEFFRRDFVVDERVLIPRPETEILVETALEAAPRNALVADIGTGSGCIAISIERERPDLTVLGVDRSLAALSVAATNRTRLGSRIRLIASDLLSGVRSRFDLIVSNPPYVPQSEYEQLAVEVRIHEPKIALTPGPRGTEVIERILDCANDWLAPAGRIILEVGYGQEEGVRMAAAARSLSVEAFVPDLAGIPRVVVLSAHAE